MGEEMCAQSWSISGCHRFAKSAVQGREQSACVENSALLEDAHPSGDVGVLILF